MEKNEVSIHEARVFSVFLANPKEWLTSKEIAEKADVAQRTARAHCLKLVQLGILDQAEVFPSHRYRMAEKADKRNRGYFDRVKQAMEIFGIDKEKNI